MVYGYTGNPQWQVLAIPRIFQQATFDYQTLVINGGLMIRAAVILCHTLKYIEDFHHPRTHKSTFASWCKKFWSVLDGFDLCVRLEIFRNETSWEFLLTHQNVDVMIMTGIFQSSAVIRPQGFHDVVYFTLQLARIG